MSTEQEPTWPEVDRRQSTAQTRAAFDRAVEEAARRAAQTVAAVHRRRVLVQAALVSTVAVCAIALPVIFAVGANVRSAGRANAQYDCRLFSRAVTLIGDFVRSDADLRSAQAKAGLNRELVAGFEKIISAPTLRRAQAASTQASDTAIALWRRDANGLLALGRANCQRLTGRTPAHGG